MRRTAVLTVAALGVFAAFSAAPAADAAAASTVQVYLSSESRTAGYEPKNANWYTTPATGLAGTPYQLSNQADIASRGGLRHADHHRRHQHRSTRACSASAPRSRSPRSTTCPG